MRGRSGRMETEGDGDVVRGTCRVTEWKRGTSSEEEEEEEEKIGRRTKGDEGARRWC